MKEELMFKLNIQLFAEGEDNPPAEEENPNEPLSEVVKKLRGKLKVSVPKEDYDKVKAERDQAIAIIVDGTDVEGEEEADGEEENLDERILKLGKHIGSSSNNDNNLQYMKNALELRKLVLKRDNVDIFATKVGSSNATKISITEDLEAAQKAATVFQECVDQADGDSEVFTALLQSRMVDDPTILAAIKAKEAAENRRKKLHKK